jgi:hypothetical protein
VGEGDVFERPVDRRELLKKVAVYTPPLVLGGTALMNAGVALAATGETSSSSTPFEGSLSSSSSVPSEGSVSSSGSGSSSGHSYQDPRALLEADLAALIAIPSTGNPSEDKKVAQAVGFLTEATQSSRWSDDYELVLATGDATFYDLKWAADALQASSNSSATSLTSDVDVAAGTLANYAYDNASPLPAKTDKKVQRKLATAGTRSASGNVRGAIAAYMHAWDLVVSGTESPDGDDAS